MRLKKLNAAACVCALVFLAASLAATALTAAPALALPEGRVYEMVSPPYKADYGAAPNAVAPDGERVVFTSLGVFAGARADALVLPYIARRSSNGWVTSSTNPPPTQTAWGDASDERIPTNVYFDPDVSRQIALVSADKGGNIESAGFAGLVLSDLLAPDISSAHVWPLPDRSASFPCSGSTTQGSDGPSSDLSHILFPNTDAVGALCQIVGVGGPEPREELVAAVGGHYGPGGSILQECLGGSSTNTVSLYERPHAISDNGSEIFFSHCDVPYVRVNGSETFELSPAGEFWAASHDGSKAFFTNGAGELLMDVIDGEPGHEAVSETVPVTPGAEASVVVCSDDGSHVYFTSPGVLTGANTQEHSPEAGASNLYVYDSLTRETAFIAVSEVDKNGGNYEAQTTPDGRFLVFTSDSRLTPDDTDTAASVYRYDAQTGGLVRVSVGENGHDDNGNGNGDASIAAPAVGAGPTQTWRLETRAISDDGATIVFSTAAPLSPRAVNGKVNVYVWHEGRVGMISTGLSQSADEFPVVSQSGRDIFFLTSQSILPQDSDGLADIYDARIGGGFPEPPVPAGGCSGDTCQGPPSVPSLLGAPASVVFHGLGNPVEVVSKAVVKSKGKPKPKCKRGYVRNKKGKCVKVKMGARKAATASRRGHKSSRGGSS
jgi:Tol biopolymer transport system component